mmetsp:Transcript_13399/g.27966  ORF Transcript_13399/g.27966 Transcript_13399/m.27966 type:complete len:244 (-) Transcript_13399:56-787(-)
MLPSRRLVPRWRRNTTSVVAIGWLFLVAALVRPGPGAFVSARIADRVAPLHWGTRLHSLVTSRATPLADLEVGQSMKGKIARTYKTAGFFMDVGAERDGLLEIDEMQDGFPTRARWNELKKANGTEVEVRVLDKTDGKLYLTMRSGDLTRPPRRRGPKDPKARAALEDIGSEKWLEGEVEGIAFVGAFINVAHPASGVVTSVLVPQEEFTESFLRECIRGGKVRIRIGGKDEKGLLWGTMKNP